MPSIINVSYCRNDRSGKGVDFIMANSDTLSWIIGILAICLALIGFMLPEQISSSYPSTFPYGNLTDIPQTFPYGNLTGIPTVYNLTDGLVCWLPSNDGIGNVTDYSGFMNHGLISGASWVDGKYGKALSFDGIDNHAVTVPNSASLSISNELTIILWLKRNSTLRSEGPLSRHGSTLTYGFYFYINNDKVTFEIRGATPDTLVSNTAILPSSGWTFLAATFKANDKAIIYINGVNDKQINVTGAINTASNDLLLGYRSHTFNGSIDEVRIYNRVLSSAEILVLYNLP